MYEDVKIEKADSVCGDEMLTHPAFAGISASRVRGGRVVLYGSDFVSESRISIRIAPSVHYRGLSRNRYHSTQTREFIEIEMTESQWATFVSSIGVGSGVPCTVSRFNGSEVPAIPALFEEKKAFGKEVREKLSNAISHLRNLKRDVIAASLPKRKTEEIASRLSGIEQEINANLAFVIGSFDEHMEEKSDRLKTEIHGYMNGVLVDRGMLGVQEDNLKRIEIDNAKSE